ncbi:hypothetical protein D3C81_1808820 [compost metagenome]
MQKAVVLRRRIGDIPAGDNIGSPHSCRHAFQRRADFAVVVDQVRKTFTVHRCTGHEKTIDRWNIFGFVGVVIQAGSQDLMGGEFPGLGIEYRYLQICRGLIRYELLPDQ